MELDLEGINTDGLIYEDEDAVAPLRSTMEQAVKEKPEHRAKVVDLSQRVKADPTLVETGVDDFERKAKLDDINLEGLVMSSPGTAEYLKEINAAAVSQDDTTLLQRLEQIGKKIEPWTTYGMTKRVLEFTKNNIRPGNISEGLGADVAATFANALDGVKLKRIDDRERLLQGMNAEPIADPKLKEVIEGLTPDYDTQREGLITSLVEREVAMGERTPEDLSLIEEGVRAGVISLSQMLPAFGIAAATRTGTAGVLATMGSQVYADSYGRARAEGLSAGEATVYAGLQAAVEVGTEVLPVKTLISIATAPGASNYAREAIRFAVQEMGTEQLATLGQTIIDYGFELDEQLANATDAGEVLDIQLRRQAVTAVATLVGGGAQMAGAAGIREVSRRLMTEEELIAAQTATEQAQLDELNEIATQSKTKERSKFMFKRFMQQAVDADQKDVYIDAVQAKLYLNSMRPEEVEADPGLRLLRDTIENNPSPNGDVPISLGDFATDFAGSMHYDALRPHMKLSTETSTPFRAEADRQQQQSYIQSLMEQADQNASKYVENKQIFDNTVQQLVDTGVMTPKLANYMAQVVPAYVTVVSDRTGQSPEEVFKLFGLTIEGPYAERREAVAQGRVLEQPPAYRDAAAVYNKVRDNFLDRFAEDTLIEDVIDEIDTFSVPERNFLRALDREDWLGFDHPSQAIHAVLSDEIDNYEVSQQLKSAIGRMVNQYFATDLMDAAPRETQNTYQQPRVDEEANLFVTHNITPQGVIYANKLGGLAAPSLAVARADISGFEGFGEISLLADASILESPRARTFDADIYTPRQPRPQYDADMDAVNSLNETLIKSLDGVDLRLLDIQSIEDADGPFQVERSDALQYHFLKERGAAPKPKLKKASPEIKKASKLTGDKFQLREDPKFIKIATDYYTQMVDAIVDFKDVRSRMEVDRYRARYFTGSGELNFGTLNDFAAQVVDFRDSKYDSFKLKQDIAKKFRNKKLQTDYEQFARETFESLITRRVMFQGFTPSGNRKYAEYTLENVVREMTKQLQAGETFFHGAGQVRSAYANELKTVKAVQAARDKIVDKNDMETIKSDASEVLSDALEKLKQHYKYDADGFGYYSDAGQALAEGVKGVREAFEDNDEVRQIVGDLTEYLTELPTDYFEAKLQRPVQFSEFNTAVVPKNLGSDVKDILKKAGLIIRQYDPNDPDDRLRVINKQKQLLFQEHNQGAARGYYDPENVLIRLNEAADASTFLHEFAHFVLDMERRMDSPEMQPILQWWNGNKEDIAKEASQFLDTDMGDYEQSGVDVSDWLKPMGQSYSIGDETLILDEGDIQAYQADYQTSTSRSIRYVKLNEAGEIVGTLQFHTKGSRSKKATISYVYTREDYRRQKVAANLLKRARQDFDIKHSKDLTDKGRLFAKADGVFYQGDTPTGKPDRITEQDVERWITEGTTGSPLMDDAIDRATHEQFARAFETYIMEGKAPSTALRNAFRVFARLLRVVYDAVRLNSPNMTDDMRRVFDRLLASEEQIAAEQARSRYAPLFTDAAMAGMTDEQYAAYLERSEQATDKATETVRDKLMKEMRRTTEKWWNRELNEIAGALQEEIGQQPVYVARERLRSDPKFKLDRAMVKEMLGVDRIPPALRNMTITGAQGATPDDAAIFFGYTSGTQMLDELMNAPKIADAAMDAAHQEMINIHGDMLNDGSIEQAAMEAARNTERAELILDEIKALSRDTATPAIDKKVLSSLAAQAIGKLPLKQIRPDRYRRAEIRSAQDAARAMQSGDRALALRAKTAQIMNMYLWKEAMAAREMGDRITRYMGKFKVKATRQRIGKAGNGYLDQIDKILERFEFRRGVSMKQVEMQRQTIETWAAARREEGDNLVLTPEVMAEAYRKHWKDVPIDELTGIYESVLSIEHNSRSANEITIAEEKLSYEQAVERMLASMSRVTNKFNPQRTDIIDQRNPVRRFIAEQTKVPFLMSWLDGGERVGVMSDAVMRPINDAFFQEQQLWKQVGKVVVDAIKGRSKEDMKRHSRKLYIPEIKSEPTDYHTGHDGALYGHQVLAVALNTGNESNLRKMLIGEGWARDDSEVSIDNPKLQAVLKYMTRDDWDLVQTIWDQINLLYPLLADVHERTSGLPLPRVESTPIETPYGTYEGGYYPVHYDPNRSQKAAENAEKMNEQTLSMFNGAGLVLPTVSTGARVERTEYVGPIKLSLGVVNEHVHEVIHFVTHYEAVRQVMKVIKDPRIAEAIKAKVGSAEYNQLKPWLNDVAKDGRGADTKVVLESLFGRLRTGVTLGIMGFKASTILIQGSGIFNTMAEVGPVNTLRAARSIFLSEKTIREAYDYAWENSKVLEHRVNTMDREVRNVLASVEGKSGVFQKVQEVSMMGIALFQTYTVDVVSWYAGYMKGMKDFEGDHERSIRYADFVVENAQGSGATKDMASIMRNRNEAWRLFTMFMTFFSSLFNMMRDTGRGAMEGRYSIATVGAKTMFMFLLPALYEAVMRAGIPDDEDEAEKLLEEVMTNAVMMPASSMPVVRDLINSQVSGFGYNASPVLSIVEGGMESIPAMAERLANDEEITRAQMKNFSRLMGAAFKVPGVNQMWGSYEHVEEVIENGEDYTTRELLFGPDRD